MTEQQKPRIDRRTALKVIAAAAAAPAALGGCEPGDQDPGAPSPATHNPLAAGTPSDPDLLAPVVPWERSLTEDELETLTVLCDMIIPADDRSPAASALGAHEFIDEWVSAPYDGMKEDKVLVRGGIVWLDGESNRRFGSRFRELTASQMTEICDDICYGPDAEPEFQAASRFFDKVRDLTATAFYTTKEGMEDVGYVGNIPLSQWDPPPPEALRHVGLKA
ncbi:MAG: gluconate 2-dehydrogenase subunit 3 family protein [Gemmatimonadota bacterium]